MIVECKIDQNFVSKSQRRRYVEGFQDVERKHLVFLTQKRTAETASSLESIPDDISIRQLTWMEVLNPLFEDKFSDDSGLIEDFKSYFVRSFERMDLIQEILVQDVRDPEEIERYFNHFLYKRDETSGRPLYFCPYFTQKANGEAVEENVSEGINFISRVLGMKTINPEVSNNNPSLDTELQKFESESETNIPLHDKWKAGLQDIENIRTVYFLDQPRKLPKSIIKRETKGSEFGSMNSQISKNYSMGFERLFAYLEEV